MKISVKQTGGYLGLNKSAAVDTEDLDTATRQEVEQMVQYTGLFDLPATITGGMIGADLVRYEITVAEGNRQHTVTFLHDGSPETEPLRKLADRVISLGLP